MTACKQPKPPLIVLVAVLISGCGGKDTLLPQDGPTMKEVYDRHFQHGADGLGDTPSPGSAARERADFLNRGPGYTDLSLAGWTREQGTEIQNLFARLPNPDLVMYVFPHLSGQNHPVPGYATTFPMYEKTEYALPGEIGGRE